jgi:hypothetical protein
MLMPKLLPSVVSLSTGLDLLKVRMRRKLVVVQHPPDQSNSSEEDMSHDTDMPAGAPDELCTKEALRKALIPPSDPVEYARRLRRAEIGLLELELQARFPHDPELEQAMHAMAERKLAELGRNA